MIKYQLFWLLNRFAKLRSGIIFIGFVFRITSLNIDEAVFSYYLLLQQLKRTFLRIANINHIYARFQFAYIHFNIAAGI